MNFVRHEHHEFIAHVCLKNFLNLLTHDSFLSDFLRKTFGNEVTPSFSAV